MCVCVCVCVLYVNCFGRTMLYMYTEYHILVNMYHVRAQGVDERIIMYIIIIIAWNGNTPKSQHYFK